MHIPGSDSGLLDQESGCGGQGSASSPSIPGDF